MHLRPAMALSAALALAALLTAGARAQVVTLAPDHPDGHYHAGETAAWQVAVTGGAPAEAAFVVKQGGLTERARGRVALSGGRGTISARLDEPGSLLLEVTVSGDTGGTVRALSGALFSGGQIKPSAPRPADFDAFWQAKLGELAGVPTNAVLTPVDCGRTNVAYWQISLDNIRGSHIRGQLARPLQGDRLPAMLIVQWAGVYGLQTNWVADQAAAGWLALNINAHDLPIDQPAAFYKDQGANALKDYTGIGNDDREKSYFLRMYLSCYRAADYLAHRPDWNGQVLVVTGGSQGGLQSFVTAALHPRITALLANVPAGCDMHGPDAGRAPGWPMWYYKTADRNTNDVRQAARYYDVVNFASRIACPMLVGVGLIDQTCPPAGVYAACNQASVPKEIVLMPRSGHAEKDHSQAPYYARFNAWLTALRQGQPPPVQP